MIAATLPFLDDHLRAMVEVQRLTGMRPGEICGLRFHEVERTGGVWLYRPADHKTAHHGRQRVIPIGPKAQGAIVVFLRRDGVPPEGFDHIRLNDPDHRDARLVMADAYQDAGRVRDAGLLRDTARAVVLVGGCVVDPAAAVINPSEAREEQFLAMRAKRKCKVTPSQVSRRKANPERVPGTEYQPTGYAHAVSKAAKRAGTQHWHPN